MLKPGETLRTLYFRASFQSRLIETCCFQSSCLLVTCTWNNPGGVKLTRPCSYTPEKSLPFSRFGTSDGMSLGPFVPLGPAQTYFFCIGGGAKAWRSPRPDSGASLVSRGTEPVVSPSVQAFSSEPDSEHIVSADFPVSLRPRYNCSIISG